MKANKYNYLKVIQQNYGQGWEDDELENHEDNLQRLFWLACGNISDMI